jgi:hypothetical protein
MRYCSILVDNKPNSCEECSFCIEGLVKTDEKTYDVQKKCMFEESIENCPMVECSVDKMLELEKELNNKG